MNINICRTCLKSPADTHISELEKCLSGDNKNYLEVMMFCLDIKVTEDSKITTKLCDNCYRKITSFYKFKVLALKNDAYLKSLDSGEQLGDQKLTVYVDENGIKHENFLDSDDFEPSLIEDCNTEIKVEVNVKVEDKLDVQKDSDNEVTLNFDSDEEPLSVVQKVKYEDIREQTKNDAYFKSLDSGVRLGDQKLTVYVDENGIKHENFLDSDDFGPSLIEDCNTEIKVEVNVKVEDKLDVQKDSDNEVTLNFDSDEEPLSIVQKVKYKDISEQTKVNAPKLKKRVRLCPKKALKKSKEKHSAQICEECGKSFRNLKEHLLQHQPETERRKVQCQACPKLFLNKGDRHRHYKTVHLGLKKKCGICNKEVTRMSVHMARHNPSTLRFPCVECERRFVSQTELDAHVISHNRNYEYAHECPVCQKKFSRKPFVARHIRQVHEKERKHQCELCPKAFFTNNALQEHLGTHSTERPLECNECGLSLKTKETLRAHLTVHSAVRSYQCELCDKSFRTTGNLKVHMVTHTKEKPYECRYCGVRFGRAHHRSRHEFTAHQKKDPKTE